LTPEEKRLAAGAFKIFKQNPFDPRLRPHKIHKLSAIYGKTIHAVELLATCERRSISKAT
jgi:hypothetical protein